MAADIVEFLARNFSSSQFNVLKDYPNDITTLRYATVREIDFKIVDNRLQIYFSRCRNVGFGSYNDFLEILEELCDGTFQFMPDPPTLKDPFDSHLSLNHGVLGFVIYKLSDKNWQFSRNWHPVTIDDAGYAKECFFHARRVSYENGQLNAETGNTNERDNCKVAYLVADGHKARHPDTNDFIDHINLYVDLYFDDIQRRRYTPLIIDPDIRFPGGSEP